MGGAATTGPLAFESRRPWSNHVSLSISFGYNQQAPLVHLRGPNTTPWEGWGKLGETAVLLGPPNRERRDAVTIDLPLELEQILRKHLARSGQDVSVLFCRRSGKN